ncbi:MAG: toxin-antitoxin system YwqK family antitoxin [Clostridiales bacterium]|nr:toxin-antitoxin system YwqK family antitoxin [Clostridiales bacterium]
MKKIISLILILCLVTGLLTSCNLAHVSTEEDIIYMQVGGYLYTSITGADIRSERNCLNERKTAIKNYLKVMKTVSKNAFTLTSALNSYDDAIIKYIDKADPQTDNDRMMLRNIVDKIVIYKVKIDALGSEITSYQKMKLNNPALSAAFAVYENDAICTLFQLQEEYLMFLSEGAVSLFLILKESGERQSGKFVDLADSILNKKIEPAREDLTASVEKAALMHSYIISGDYMLAQYNLRKATNNIATVKLTNSSPIGSSEITDFEEYIDSLRTSSEEPPVMKPIPEDSSEGHLRLTRSVSAMDDPQIWILVDATLPLFDMANPIYKDKGVDLPPTNHMDKVTESKPSESGPPSSPLPVELSEDAGYMTKISKDTTEKTTDAIAKINSGQIAISLMGFISTTDDKYNMILNQVTGLIANGKINLSEEKRLKAVTLIKNNVNELIGENREDFVNKLTSESAEKIYDTFITWKSKIKNLEDHNFTIDDMRALLTGLGIEVTKPVEQPEPSLDSTQPVNVVNGALPSAEDYAYPQILLEYEGLKAVNQEADNSAILSTVFGWIDPIDYSTLEKKEDFDDNGKLEHEYYVYDDSSEEGMQVGWYIDYRTEAVYYEYKFPESIDRHMRITRDISTNSDLFISVTITYSDLNRIVNLAYNMPDAHCKVSSVSESTNSVRDGLQATDNSAYDTFSYWEEGKQLFSYYYKGEQLDTHRQWEYDGNTVYQSTWKYRENGNPQMEEHLKDGLLYGTYLIYYENGNLKKRIEYNNGEIDGNYEEFYESGQLLYLKVYSNGEMNGEYKRYYDNESHQISDSGSYLNGMKEGIWIDYDEVGTVEHEIEYHNDVLDGIYKYYGNRYGQYRDGKEHGIWYYGKTQEDWSQSEYYENGIRIWKQSRSSTTRTYFNPDGSVNRQEIIEE